MENIKAVIFDLDNTLVNRKTAFLNYSKNFLNENVQNFGKPEPFDDMVKFMEQEDKNGFSKKQDLYEAIINKWDIHGLSVDMLVKKHTVEFGKYTVLDADTLTVLNYLKPRYKLGIITNGSGITQNEKIDCAGIRNYFNSIIVSGMVGKAKPDREIFELSCSELAIKPEEAVFVGDIYELDIVGAVNAGLNAIWYTGISSGSIPYEHKISRLSELTGML